MCSSVPAATPWWNCLSFPQDLEVLRVPLTYETKPPIDVRESRIGLIYGLGASLSWGLAPAYYRLLNGVPPVQILAHRIFWSVLLLLPLVVRRRLWAEIAHA